MSAAIAIPVRTFETDETLDAVLGPPHDAWVEEARQLLLPACAVDAAVWERWPVVRWINERFLQRYLAERALVSELKPLVTDREQAMMEAGEDLVAALRLGLDRIARRRGGLAEFVTVAEELLRALEVWCAEIELAARHVRVRSLTPAGRHALREVLEASPVMQAI